MIVTEGHQFQNEFGIFKHNDLIGRPFGIKWKSHNPTNGEKFLYVLHPTPELWTNVLSHRTQIIYSMDAAFISLALNIKPGSFVIESGNLRFQGILCF